ncbi:MAG TPA: hypothetical protein VHB98_09210 [Chloroflexota bacterium]|nr:hypothetical protein [Chloroflexota bacterium]
MKGKGSSTSKTRLAHPVPVDGTASALVLTSYEQRVAHAPQRDLQRWAAIGAIAAPIVYVWAAGWPPARLLLFVAGLGLVLLQLALVAPIEQRALTYRKRGAASGISLSTVVRFKVLFLGVRALIACDLLVESASLSWGLVLKVVMLSLCDDPVRRYIDAITLRRMLDPDEHAAGTAGKGNPS